MEARFNIKMSSYQYRKSHCGDKTVVRSSYLHNGISYTDKTTSLCWIRAQFSPTVYLSLPLSPSRCLCPSVCRFVCLSASLSIYIYLYPSPSLPHSPTPSLSRPFVLLCLLVSRCLRTPEHWLPQTYICWHVKPKGTQSHCIICGRLILNNMNLYLEIEYLRLSYFFKGLMSLKYLLRMEIYRYVECGDVITQSIFSTIFAKKTPHSLPLGRAIGLFCGIKQRFIFCPSDCNIVLYWTAL